MWTFMATSKWFGDKAVVSPNCDEAYVVRRTGTWVPDVDVKHLEAIRWPCAACGRSRVQVFAKINATRAQMSLMPSRPPKFKRRRRKKSLVVEVSDDRVVSTAPEEE